MSEIACVNCGHSFRVFSPRPGVVPWGEGGLGDRCPKCRLPAREPVIEDELDAATERWSLPLLLRIYRADDAGRARFEAEVRLFGLHAYVPTTQSEEGGHVHAGRLLLTGGWSVLAGQKGIRSKGGINVTYVKEAAPNGGVDPTELLAKLARLREAGVLTPEEFETKKRQILDRI